MLDLSKEFHPVPKPAAKGKKEPKPLKTMGKKTTEWKDFRTQLKEKFEKWGITECELKLEGCWKANALGFAHIDKRVNLRPDELTSVVLACNVCHQKVEYLPHKQMREIIQKTIDSRESRD